MRDLQSLNQITKSDANVLDPKVKGTKRQPKENNSTSRRYRKSNQYNSAYTKDRALAINSLASSKQKLTHNRSDPNSHAIFNEIAISSNHIDKSETKKKPQKHKTIKRKSKGKFVTKKLKSLKQSAKNKKQTGEFDARNQNKDQREKTSVDIGSKRNQPYQVQPHKKRHKAKPKYLAGKKFSRAHSKRGGNERPKRQS